MFININQQNNKVQYHVWIRTKIWKQSDPSEALIRTKLHESCMIEPVMFKLMNKCNIPHAP
jgi:hypothetical protein